MRILIDGYNLIFECGLHEKRVDARSLSRARRRLLKEIVALMTTSQQRETTVVFDARKQMFSGQQEQERFHQVQVLYSIHYHEADEMIEHLIDQHSSPKQLTVVSSDHRIQKAARRRKAHPIDSGRWYDELQCRGNAPEGEQESIYPAKEAESGGEKLLTDKELDAIQAEIERADLKDDIQEWF